MQEPEDALPREAKRDNDGLVLLITWGGFLTFGATLGVSIAIGAHLLRHSLAAQFALIALAMVTLLLLIGFGLVVAAVLKADFPDLRARRRSVRMSILLGVGVLIGITLMVVLVQFGGG